MLASKIELMRGKAKVECLLEQMKSLQDEGKLESQRWKIQEMKWMPEEGVESSGLQMQLEEQIAKSELLL